MKVLMIAIVFMVSAHASAFTSCKNAEGTFSVSIYESDPVKMLVMDESISVAPLSYLCEKSVVSSNGDILVGYGCVGGDLNGGKKIAVYVNETKNTANYTDLIDGAGSKDNLKCEVSK